MGGCLMEEYLLAVYQYNQALPVNEQWTYESDIMQCLGYSFSRLVHTCVRWRMGAFWRIYRFPGCITKAISLVSVLAYFYITQSDWPTVPALPEKLNISKLFDRTDGPTMHFASAPCKVNEIRRWTEVVWTRRLRHSSTTASGRSLRKWHCCFFWFGLQGNPPPYPGDGIAAVATIIKYI